MPIILGIDPGSRVTGYGVIQVERNKIQYIDSGCIRVRAEDFDQRLLEIFDGINTIVEEFKPDTAAIEQVFMHYNAQSALKLGQARGAAIVAMASHGLSVGEYSARQIKQSVVGYGAAVKAQVQEMIISILKLNASPAEDAADALACALCHHHTRESLVHLGGAKKIVKGRLQ